MWPDRPVLTVRQVRRGPDVWVLAVAGELSLASAGLVREAVTKALADSGRVLVDLSGLRVTWPPAVQLFGSILAGMGGWPGMRLVLFGADTALVRLLDALRVSVTVPVAPDETTAYRLLKRRPPAVARYLDLEQPRSATRRARTFVRAACTDWQLEDICDDAMLVTTELVSNAVLHAGTACRLTVQYNALGLTVAVRDHRPDRMPRPPPIDFEPPQRLCGLFVVAACSREWGVTPGEDEKTVWALLPVGDSTNYSRAIRKAAHDAVRAALAHGGNPVAAESAVRQIAARLTDQHGARALSDMIEQLAHDLADVTTTTPSVSGRDGQNVADNGSTAAQNPTTTNLSWWDEHPPYLT